MKLNIAHVLLACPGVEDTRKSLKLEEMVSGGKRRTNNGILRALLDPDGVNWEEMGKRVQAIEAVVNAWKDREAKTIM